MTSNSNVLDTEKLITLSDVIVNCSLEKRTMAII